MVRLLIVHHRNPSARGFCHAHRLPRLDSEHASASRRAYMEVAYLQIHITGVPCRAILLLHISCCRTQTQGATYGATVLKDQALEAPGGARPSSAEQWLWQYL